MSQTNAEDLPELQQPLVGELHLHPSRIPDHSYPSDIFLKSTDNKTRTFLARHASPSAALHLGS
jgi:hypothetical protein